MEMVFSSNSSFYTVFGPFYIFIVQEYTILRDLDLFFLWFCWSCKCIYWECIFHICTNCIFISNRQNM